MPTEEEPAFQCPRCETPTGKRERLAVFERDEVKLIVRCHQCRHRWSVIVPGDGKAPGDRAH